MYWMRNLINLRCMLTITAMFVGVVAAFNLTASELSLEDVETLALSADPGIRAVEANQQALDELAVAATQLPDPMLKMGLVSVPTDSFNLSQEPMTQAQLGLVQVFPRGHTRSLRSEQISLRSDGLDEMIRDQKLQIILAVREQFLEVEKQQHLAMINAEAIVAFTDLVDITQDYYATGRRPQQDVLQASVELAKVQDRATRIAQAEESARAKLATWVGNVAFKPVQTSWPALKQPEALDVLKENLKDHPRIQAVQKNVQVADTGVELARQNYKPQFSVDLTYGGRSGTNTNGSPRSDLLSLMVILDVPLFRKNRQDRVLAAQIAESSSAAFGLDDIYRRMQSEIDLHSAMFRRQKERVALFENTLLPEARYSSEATLEAYQSSIQDLTTLLRAQITEFDLQLEHANLQAEVLISQARLLYLEGEQK